MLLVFSIITVSIESSSFLKKTKITVMLITRHLLFIGFGVSIAIFAALIFQFSPKSPSIKSTLWTKEELAKYNGTDDNSPVLLGILGSVFDVTKGKSHYGPGGGYQHFAGRDASRAFISGNFTGEGLTDSLHGLSSVQMKSVVDWRDFYFRSYM
ncbi:hypothetical protein GIB67_035273 [Kingdonia uniflora]|uniref:Cytochrome b5 heme-binding domain-containing protein n=1 Tax=Kingdonia uniflora TaxID=39325 RepID=A0A7J7KY18_9MAGN|nr:hypothetical protein GIB67_035273 [Kingdonia uniflora]